MDESNDVESKLKLMMLQLQRSALIDTQTLFQILIDKNICSVDDIVCTRSEIETNNEDVHKLDSQIAKLCQHADVPLNTLPKSVLMQQLKELLKDLNVT